MDKNYKREYYKTKDSQCVTFYLTLEDCKLLSPFTLIANTSPFYLTLEDCKLWKNI